MATVRYPIEQQKTNHHPESSTVSQAQSGKPKLADGELAVWCGIALARMPDAARQRRGLQLPPDSRAQWERRQGSRDYAAGIGDSATPPAPRQSAHAS